MVSEVVERCLRVWAEWMRQSSSRLGYPARSSVIATGSGGYGQSWEDWEAAEDARLAKLTDAAIGSLPWIEQVAIHHVWLGARWEGEDVGETYRRAIETLAIGLRRRGVEC